jgi:chemotaxis protein MotB
MGTDEKVSDGSEELVIIRRRSAFNEAEYKGGVWKIAYADFMTAMMAFFLVMWLINATNQETRESVASYFNPVKLAETTPERKGLDNPTQKEPGTQGEKDKATPPQAPSPPPEAPEPAPSAAREPQTPSHLRTPRYDEAALFRDPYAILTDIAGGPSVKVRREQRIGISLDPAGREGTKSGEAHRDPFDPIYWQMAPQASIEQGSARSGERGSLPIDEDLAALAAGEPKPPASGRLDVASPGRPTRSEAAAVVPDSQAQAVPASLSPEARQDAQKADEGKDPRLAPKGPVVKEPATQEALAKDIAPNPDQPNQPKPDQPKVNSVDAAAKDLQAAIRAAMAASPKPGPVVDVQRTDEGLLVSLTDAADFGMFAIGSAEPQPELVRAIDKIAPLIAERPGAIVVRGHTDGRQFRSPHYDNWRLSSARAHMAYHMLVRGGAAPARIVRIEGHADRRLKKADDPLAAQNRRIEILLKEGPS